MQPDPLELTHENQQPSAATQDVTNATIRDLLTPTVLTQGPDKAENVQKASAQCFENAANGEKFKFLGCKGYSDFAKLPVDSLRRAEANGDVRERVAATVLAQESDKAQNPSHCVSKINFSEINSKNLPFLGCKEHPSSENLQVDSSRHAEANGSVRDCVESPIFHALAKNTPKQRRTVLDGKIHMLQAVINAIDDYSIDMEELAHQQTLDADFRQLHQDARTGL